MGVPVDKLFLVIGLIALPNLYYISEYNVPLMLFFMVIWEFPYHPTIVYLLVFSWLVDIFRIVK